MDKAKETVIKIINDIRSDRKKMIAAVAALSVIVILVLPGRNKKEPEGFGTQLSQLLGSDFYTAEGTATLCGRNFEITAEKSDGNFQAGFSDGEIDCSKLVTVYNGNIYLDGTGFDSEAGIACIRADETGTGEESTVLLSQIAAQSLDSECCSYSSRDGFSEVKLAGEENIREYFGSLASAVRENRDSIAGKYRDRECVGSELDLIAGDFQKTASSDTTGEYMNFTLSENEDSTYVFTADADFAFDSLPSFLDENRFDSNRCTFYLTLTFEMSENTVNIPAGHVYPLGNGSVRGFTENCMKCLFAKKEYVSRNEVTVKADSVTNVINLGCTTEMYQYLFDKDGAAEGLLTVSSYDRNVIGQYMEKYGNGAADDKDIIFDAGTGKFSYSFSLSDQALNLVNKIAVTPDDLAAFFKTAEGVVPIV